MANGLREPGGAQSVTALLGGWDEVSVSLAARFAPRVIGVAFCWQKYFKDELYVVGYIRWGIRAPNLVV